MSVATLSRRSSPACGATRVDHPARPLADVPDHRVPAGMDDLARRIPTPVLVTGVTGVAGWSLMRTLRAVLPGKVIGTRPPVAGPIPEGLAGGEVVALDAADGEGLGRLFDRHGFRAVVNAVGNCALKSCELAPAMARRLNVDSAAAVARIAARHGARLVHLSSDLVFSGVQPGPRVETDPVDPVTIYGKTMVEGEAAVADLHPGAAVLRISLPMGPSVNGHAGAVDWIASRFRRGLPATLYYDEVRTPSYVEDIDRVCAEFLAGTWGGLWHAGGARAMSLYRIAQVVNRAGRFAPELLRGCPRAAAGPMPPRAGDVTMDSGKLAAALGRTPMRGWPADGELVPDDDAWHLRGRREEGAELSCAPADGTPPCGESAIRRRLYLAGGTGKVKSTE